MSNKIITEQNFTTNGNESISKNQKVNVSEVEKSSLIFTKKANSTPKNLTALDQRIPDPISAANKTSIQPNSQKRTELLSDMSKIILNITKVDTKPIVSKLDKVKEKIKEEKDKFLNQEKELKQLKIDRRHANEVASKYKNKNPKRFKRYEKKVELFDEKIATFDTVAIEESRKKRTEYVKEARSLMAQLPDDLGIVMALTPKILEAIESDNFTTNFIENLCNKILSVQPMPSYLLNIHRQLHAISSNPVILKALNDNIKNYIQQKNHAKDEILKQKCIKNAMLFIYNTIAFPHQRSGEGSCYATAIAKTIYHNQKIAYMEILRGIIDNDTVDFSCLGSKVEPIKVSNFGIDCNELDMVYQKLISAMATLTPSTNDNQEEVFRCEIADICEIIGETAAEIISTDLIKEGFVWNHYRIPAVCSFTDVLRTKIDVLAHIQDKIKEIISSHNLDNAENDKIAEIAEKIFTKIKGDGGLTEEVANGISGGKGIRCLEQIHGKTLKDSIFDLAQIQQILNGLECGNFDGNESQKLRKDQSVVAGFEGVEGGHAFTLFSGHYDISSMPIGDKIRIGHMNYLDNAYSDSYIDLIKISNNQFQLVCEGKPISQGIKKFELYPDLATEYEPAEA